jgi:hypothetical protein
MSRGKFADLTGMVFERLTVIGRDYTRRERTYWWCICSCNNELLKKSIPNNRLTSGNTKSCGCLRKELTGKAASKRLKKYNNYDLSGEYGIGYTSKGEEFYFDLEDYDLIKDYCWRKTNYGYISSKRNRKQIFLHRLVMGVVDESLKIKVDHVKHKKYDNRKSELRKVTSGQNNINRELGSNNKSGVTGVHWDKKVNKWIASIGLNKKYIVLGSFSDFEDAIKARKEAEEKYFGEYSYDNSMNIDKDPFTQEQNDFSNIS